MGKTKRSIYVIHMFLGGSESGGRRWIWISRLRDEFRRGGEGIGIGAVGTGDSPIRSKDWETLRGKLIAG